MRTPWSQSTEITAQDFLAQAEENGFMVLVEAWLAEQHARITLSKKVFAGTEVRLSDTKEVGRELAGLVQREPGVGKGAYQVEVVKYQERGVAYKRLMIEVNRVDSHFLQGIAEGSFAMNERLAQKEELYFSFDAKVVEEIENDSEVLRIKSEMAALHGREVALGRDLITRKELMWVERQELRETYLQVADPREL